MWAQERLELVDGELISKMGQNQPHIFLLTRVMQWLLAVFGPDRVNPNATIDVSPEDNPTNQPEPDVIVRKEWPADYPGKRAQPGDLLLVVEISDSTLWFDLNVKARLYARAGIVEYWALDVAGRRMVVHREPGREGYRSVVAYNEGEGVSPLAAPENHLVVGELFASRDASSRL
jgi:Uma2 family endonuclease